MGFGGRRLEGTTVAPTEEIPPRVPTLPLPSPNLHFPTPPPALKHPPTPGRGRKEAAGAGRARREERSGSGGTERRGAARSGAEDPPTVHPTMGRGERGGRGVGCEGGV